MKERPILFSGPMVRAILDGRKTQTRREIKKGKPSGLWGRDAKLGESRLFFPSENAPEGAVPWWECGGINGANEYCPYGPLGEILWVKEKFAVENKSYIEEYKREPWRGIPDRDTARTFYAADKVNEGCGIKWVSPRFMPKWACRIKLKVVSVRVERLQSITEDDAMAEGIYFDHDFDGYVSDNEGRHYHGNSAVRSYEHLWHSINGPESWNQNPWVWVIEFRNVSPS
jgi:hypothetical protein